MLEFYARRWGGLPGMRGILPRHREAKDTRRKGINFKPHEVHTESSIPASRLGFTLPDVSWSYRFRTIILIRKFPSIRADYRGIHGGVPADIILCGTCRRGSAIQTGPVLHSRAP
jgi:hypothetical protein